MLVCQGPFGTGLTPYNPLTGTSGPPPPSRFPPRVESSQIQQTRCKAVQRQPNRWAQVQTMSDQDGQRIPSGNHGATSAAKSARYPLFNARDAVEYLGISLSPLTRIEKQALLVPFRPPGGPRRYGPPLRD